MHVILREILLLEWNPRVFQQKSIGVQILGNKTSRGLAVKVSLISSVLQLWPELNLNISYSSLPSASIYTEKINLIESKQDQ